MAMVWNPTTGKYEDDGQGPATPITVSAPIVTDLSPITSAPTSDFGQEPMTIDTTRNIDPRTGMPTAGAAPDEVRPGDLQVGTVAPILRDQALVHPSDLAVSQASLAGGKQAQVVDTNPADAVAAFPSSAGGINASALPATPAPAAKPLEIGNVVTTERMKQSKEALAGQANALAAAKGEEGIAARQGELGKGQAKDLADLAASEAQQKEIERRVEEEGRLAARQKLEAAYAERDRILNDAQKQSTADYWSDKPAGAKVLADFASSLGTYVAIRSGTGINYAQQTIDREFARDDARKQQILKNSIYRAGLKGQDAKDAYDFGIQEINLRKSALLEKLADNRAAKRAAMGVDTADIQKDELINAAKMKAAQLQAGFGELANVKVHSSNQLAQEYKMKQALDAQKAAEAAANPSQGAKGIVDARQRAQLAGGIRDQAAVASDLAAKGVKLTPEDLKTIQDNRTYLKGVESGHSVGGALETTILRKLGSLPRSEFDGLDENKQALAGALNLMSQKAGLLNAGSMTGEAITHATGLNDLLAPNVGAKEMARRRDYIVNDIVGANIGLVPGAVAQVEQGIKSTRGAETPAPARAPLTKVERAKLKALLDANPNDSRAAEARARLAE